VKSTTETDFMDLESMKILALW